MADVTTRYYSEATLEGEKKTIEWSGTVSSVTQVYDQVVPLTTTKQTVLTQAANEAGATLADWTVLVLENRDATNAIDIAFEATADTEHYWFQIPAGRFMVFWDRQFDLSDSAAAGASPTYDNAGVTSVQARAAAGTPNLRIVAYDDT